MADKALENETQSTLKKERFEFKLTVNGNIICQRYFRINGFKHEVYGSLDLVDAIESCVKMINDDLCDKSRMFLEDTAPQVLKDQQQFEEWLKNNSSNKNLPDFVLIEDSEVVYYLQNRSYKPYEKPFNRYDYVADKQYENKVQFKFSFLDNGREVASKVWDGDIYPRFIRTNVDLSNSRNKYRQGNLFAPIESYMIDLFIEKKTDLIPSIVRELCNVCSYDDVEDYASTITYGDKTYDLNIYRAYRKTVRGWENKLKKKTAEYFRHI